MTTPARASVRTGRPDRAGLSRPTLAGRRASAAPVVRTLDGIQPLRDVPVSNYAGLAPDQCGLLAELCDGRSLTVTAPGGTGKSMVLARYARLLKAMRGEDVTMVGVSVDPHSNLADFMPMWPCSRTADMMAHVAAGDVTKDAILFVEEYTAFDETVSESLHLFNQVIVVGDTAQGNYDWVGSRMRLARETMGSAHRSTHIIWRSYNNAQFNMLNALVYQGRYEAYGIGTGKMPDTVRAQGRARGSNVAAAGAAPRVMRHMISNKGTTVTQVVSTREEAARVVSSLVFAAAIVTNGKRFRMVHRSLIQGIEADVMIMDHTSMDLEEPDEIEKSIIMATGRARFRTELSIDSATSSRPHAAMALRMAGTRYETIPATTADKPYAPFAAIIERDDRFVMRVGLSHVTLTEKQGNTPTLLINVMGNDHIETLFKQDVALGKKWRVATQPMEMLSSLLREGMPALESLTRPLYRPDAGNAT